METNLPNLYDNSMVKQIDGVPALAELNQGKFSDNDNNKLESGMFKIPELVVAYHPECPHCHMMSDDYKNLA